MNLKPYIDKALSYEAYVALLDDNLALHQRHYDKCEIPAEAAHRLEQMKPLTILVLTEPWCGDSLAIFPVVRKMAETAGGWTIKVLTRDENPELMDQFLTRGGRAVPIFLFLDTGGALLLRWGPRPKAAQDIFEQYRQRFIEGKMEKMEIIKKIRNFYSKDRGQSIINELLSTFEETNLS